MEIDSKEVNVPSQAEIDSDMRAKGRLSPAVRATLGRGATMVDPDYGSRGYQGDVANTIRNLLHYAEQQGLDPLLALNSGVTLYYSDRGHGTWR